MAKRFPSFQLDSNNGICPNAHVDCNEGGADFYFKGYLHAYVMYLDHGIRYVTGSTRGLEERNALRMFLEQGGIERIPNQLGYVHIDETEPYDMATFEVGQTLNEMF